METPARIGPFPVKRALGEGAAGSVYLCDHPRLGLPVAVKVLHDLDPDLLARFRLEAELMARIKHPCVVEVLEGGTSPQGPYLVLEYCPGEDLASHLHARGALPPPEAAQLVARIARGIAAAHQAGAIHRDLKPQNVLILAGGPKVTDFGIARAEGGDALESLTQSGVILGTPSYMAPEQARSARDADERSDVYALGVILYECLSGRQPFPGRTALEVLNRVVEGDADPLPPSLPDAWREVVSCAMALDPADRYSTATLLAEALEELTSAQGRRRPVFLGLAVTGFLLGALGVGAAAATGVLRSAPAPSWPSETSPSDVAARRASATPARTPSAMASETATASEAPTWAPYRSEAYFLEKQRAWRSGRVSELEAQARAGSGAAVLALGLRYQSGLGGVARDRTRAIELLKRAAGGKNADALCALGLLARRDGRREEARELLEEARQLGSHDASLVLATNSDEQRAAAEVALENARRGDPGALKFLAELAFRKGQREVAEEWIEKGIALGLPSSFALRARLERQRHDGDPERVAADYLRAAEGEEPEGLCGYARCLIVGQGVEQNLALAERYLRRAQVARPTWVKIERLYLLLAKGEVDAWSDLVNHFLELNEKRVSPHLWGDIGLHLLAISERYEGKFKAGMLRAAAKFLSRSEPAFSLDPKVCFRVGMAVKIGQIPLGPGVGRLEMSSALFERAAQQGYPLGTYAYGFALVTGQGVAQDVSKGLRLIEEAAKAGVKIGWGRLGDFYSSGVPGKLEVDREKARGYFRRGAEAGDAFACFKYATLLLNEGSDEEGARWVKRAAELGSRSGQVSYANCLLRGRGVKADPERALATLHELAKTSPLACELLAGVYREGLQVEVNLERSRDYAAQGEALRRAQGKN